MNKNDTDIDIEALSHLIDEDLLKRKYEESIESGCTPEFARTFVKEVARSMVVSEAASMTTSLRSMDGLLGKAKIF